TRRHDSWQYPQRRHGAIELPSTVVRHDDSIGTRFARRYGVRLVENSLDHQPSVPATTDKLEMLPGQVSALGIIAQDVWGHDGRPARGVVIFEVRHAMAEQRAQKGSEEPTWMRDPVPCQTQGRPERCGKTCPDVVLAVARDLRIDRNHKRAEAGLRDAIDQRRDAWHIPGKVGLKPRR